MTVVDWHRIALDEFGQRVRGISADGWHQPTPCRDWDVAAVVNHMVGENRWAPTLLAGATIDEVGDRFDGDLLGDDPAGTWDASAAEAIGAASAVALGSIVHLSFGDVPAEEYLWQLTADALVHGWDVARATGQDETFDKDLVDAVAGWYVEREELYRSAGAVGPATTPADDSPQARLLSRFGRDTSSDAAIAVIGRFNAAFNRHDLDELRTAITDDCVFVDTTPPSGRTHVGADAVLAAFGELFVQSPTAHFETLGGFVDGPRGAYRWRYRWGTGPDAFIEGVDLLTCCDGRLAEKRAYVKG